ncbi:MAG: dihydrofolate reductase family protein [Leucobacter sp.]
MRVRADLNISLDGFASTADGTPEDPFGTDWFRLVEAYTATRTMRERVFGDISGAGTTGIDDKYAAAYFEGIGAEIMGAGKFGLHLHPDDPEWRGWWGENPPFHVPVFVLTHEQRPELVMEGGTTFRFLSATPEEALALATKAANGGDVRIGGGPAVVRDFLQAGLIDELHVAIAPILVGDGGRLWDGLRGFDLGYDVATEVAESGTLHVTFTRKAGENAASEPPHPAGEAS